MAKYEFLLPAMGEGIIEATITRWMVSGGQKIKIDQPLVEVATDKVDSEIPSPVEGTLLHLFYHEGQIPKVGEVIALIETEGKPEDHSNGAASIPAKDIIVAAQEHPHSRMKKVMLSAVTDDDLVISPLVRMLAKQRGLSPDELRLMRGSGLNGSITKEDITMYMINGRHDKADNNAKPVEKKPVSGNGVSVPLPTAGPDDEVVEMDRIRKLIAGNMIRSIQLAPHVTSFREADVTPLMDWRERIKASFLEREKVKLTFTAMLTEAVALALKEFPRINVSVTGDSIIIRKHIHIGIATALPDGNLIVPVIKNADRQNLGGLARIINDLAHRARNSMLLPGESGGGTFTITNIGQYNSLTGTPVINQPESAILAAGTISKKPWAIKTSDGYGIAVRDIIMLSLTYDHRVIDGALGSGFLDCIARHLENFDVRREL